MKRVLLAVVTLLALGLGVRGKEYAVYKASYTQTYDYHFEGGDWDPQPDKYAGYFIGEATVTKETTLDRVLLFDCWKEYGGNVYEWWVTTWFRLVSTGDGQQAIVAHDSAKGEKGFVEAFVLTGASIAGPPKGYTGVHFTLVAGLEVEREEVKLRLDTKLTAAAQAAADAATGDPLTAVRQVVADYLESRGYEEDR